MKAITLYPLIKLSKRNQLPLRSNNGNVFCCDQKAVEMMLTGKTLKIKLTTTNIYEELIKSYTLILKRNCNNSIILSKIH